MGRPALELAGHWVELGLRIETEALGELSLIYITWVWEASGGAMS